MSLARLIRQPQDEVKKLRQLEEEDTWLHQGAVELLPATEGRFRDAHLAAHLGYLRSALGLLKANAIWCSVTSTSSSASLPSRASD